MLASCGLTRSLIAADVAAARLRVRRGMGRLLALARAGVPVTIFSAGIGDVIAEALMQLDGPPPPALRVVSNWMAFREGRCVGWREPLIHVFNKSADMIARADRDALADRTAVVLLGDSEGDVSMADGLDAGVVLKIGFLNDREPTQVMRERYAKIYDVVLTGDAPAWPLEDLIKDLLAARGVVG